nr:nitroreductase family protein [Desulfobotulus pelophilus]
MKNLVAQSRSVRRFVEKEAVGSQVLAELIDLARQSPSAGNLQRLRFRPVREAGERDGVFQALGWAAYLKDWQGPKPGERPAAYIVICGPEKGGEHLFCDIGIAAQTMALGAAEKGLGACMLANMDKEVLRRVLAIPESLDILLVLALGEPGEKVVMEAMKQDSSVQYWRDEKGVHHVPKRLLSDILIS